VPYFGVRAYRTVFGQPLGALWAEFARSAAASPNEEEPSPRTRLTRHGYTVSSPAFTPDGRLFYSVVNPEGFPALMERPADAEPRRVVTRYLGNRLAAGHDVLIFDQLEYVRSVGLVSDLYAVAPDGRGLRRLTREARAADPDLSPDGRTIVCTVQFADRRALATLAWSPSGPASEPAVLVSEPFTDFSAPRWSPDGRTLVAERRTAGRPYEIVLVDAATRRVTPLVAASGSRHVTPAWLPDGSGVLFATTLNGGDFAIARVDAATREIRVLRGAGPGAHAPALSPDGGTLVYVGATDDGYDLHSLPFDAGLWDGPLVVTEAAPDTAEETRLEPVERPYRPWSTLVPRFWTPVLQTDDGEWMGGAATGAADALGRHAYGATIAWSASRSRPDWTVAYAYDRWRPTLFAQISEDTDPFLRGELRSSEWNAGALLRFRRVRWSSSLFAAVHGSTDTLDCLACEPALAGEARRRAVRLGWNVDSAKRYGFSISDEEGATVVLTTELARRALGGDGDATSVTVDLRKYVRVFPRHAVVAARAAVAAAWGDEGSARVFTAGGSGPQGGGFAYGVDAIGLLRGFEEGDVFGRRAAVLNVDYRVPLARLERGVGTYPFFLRALHAAVFVDTGSAWTDRFRRADLRTSIGAEVAADTLIGYALPLTFVAGAAWLDDPAGRREGWTTFARIGRAF
jgi:hypothetical protein